MGGKNRSYNDVRELGKATIAAMMQILNNPDATPTERILAARLGNQASKNMLTLRQKKKEIANKAYDATMVTSSSSLTDLLDKAEEIPSDSSEVPTCTTSPSSDQPASFTAQGS